MLQIKQREYFIKVPNELTRFSGVKKKKTKTTQPFIRFLLLKVMVGFIIKPLSLGSPYKDHRGQLEARSEEWARVILSD